MNYELAKKLQDAGFPQIGLGKWFMVGYEVAQVLVTHFPPEDRIMAYEPSLEELIEACGKQFEMLSQYVCGESWMATAVVSGEEIEAIGPTPKEAVANLWLKLNKK